MPRPHPRLTKPETLGVGAGNLLTHCPADSGASYNLKNHCYKSLVVIGHLHFSKFKTCWHLTKKLCKLVFAYLTS